MTSLVFPERAQMGSPQMMPRFDERGKDSRPTLVNEVRATNSTIRTSCGLMALVPARSFYEPAD